jgi:hypothetical protein
MAAQLVASRAVLSSIELVRVGIMDYTTAGMSHDKANKEHTCYRRNISSPQLN